jgi:hypothetical protein
MLDGSKCIIGSAEPEFRVLVYHIMRTDKVILSQTSIKLIFIKYFKGLFNAFNFKFLYLA